jgi:phosphopantothenoylcysteine decarboxylase/phosphopantothenate--cysteine ligase
MTPKGSAPVLSGRRVLLGVSGGIAAYKSAYLARLLVEAGADVTVVMTAAATQFVGPATFEALTRKPVHFDVFERNDQVLHVRLARDADVAVVAPATANTLARLSLGLADDLLSSILLEARCPLVIAPAMHTGMWSHPATRDHVRVLSQRGAVIVGPAEGSLAAGDRGMGRMAEPEDVLAGIEDALAAGRHLDLAGRIVLVTAGPTHEPIDDVRFMGNRSSGRMGFSVARELARRGASVRLVTGPVSLDDPLDVAVVRVETADEMAAEVLRAFDSVHAVVMAAAVADFRPARAARGKLKKRAGVPDIGLEPTTDILAMLGKRKERQVLVGFAAETAEIEREARRKLVEKNLDIVVGNEVGRAGTGFGSETNRALILSRSGEDVALRDWTKAELAEAIADRLAGLLRG